MSLDHFKVSSVHEALSAASQESKDKKVILITTSFKIDPEVKELTQKICERHGTDMSSFLRKCCLALINDYQ